MNNIDLSTINKSNFESIAIELFHYQFKNNEIYNHYCKLRKVNIKTINTIENIPFLPIELFKKHKISSNNFNNNFYFESSGTTSSTNAKHYVNDINLYQKSIDLSFNNFFENYNNYHFIGLLPHYLDRPTSSLLYMANRWSNYMIDSKDNFFKNDFSNLIIKIEEILKAIGDKKLIILAVSYAILDLCEVYNNDSDKIIIIETGGMKGMRKEIIKEELWSKIKASFKNAIICSEYGMCELLSQGYAIGETNFKFANWTKMLVSDIYDPYNIKLEGTGKANIIDLANINSCCFIETQDIINLNVNNTFEVLGRIDLSEIRGCNLLFS